jgi:putative inorganic carbon (hco3(-)) transporter
MTSAQYSTRWLMWLGLVYAAYLGAAIYFEAFWAGLLPIALLLMRTALIKLDHYLLFIVFCVPFSVNLEQLEVGGIGVSLPTEPLMVGALLIFIFRALTGRAVDSRIYKHPISVFIYVYLGWMIFTTITGEMPLVSFKFVLAKIWFLVTGYFLMTHIFNNQDNITRFMWLFIISLMGVVVYTVVHHSQYGFDMKAGHWVMSPFFKDHTSYGAVLAMFIPISIALLFMRGLSPLLRFVLFVAAGILIVGVVLSYTRAAWVSLAGAAGVGLLLMARFKFRTLLVTAGLAGAFVWTAQDDLLLALEKNRQESSDNLSEHVSSISNVSSDASNLERLNRWNCALALFNERPLVGWGPGSYQFVYAPYQRSGDLTIISTNNADGGNAHSEYLGPLAEQGMPGMLLMLLLVFMVFSLGFRMVYAPLPTNLKLAVVGALLGLTTYFIHGVLNNYLDTDKAAIPFWGFISVLVAADLWLKSSKKTTAN